MGYSNSRRYDHKQNGERKQGGKGGGKTFSRDLRMEPNTSYWVRFLPGRYGNCEACGGYVMCAKDLTYECRCHTYDKDNKLITNKEGKPVRCGHKGKLEEACDYAVNYSTFVQGGGRNGKGTVVYDNSLGGAREVPSLTTAKDLKVRRGHAHNLLVYGTFHAVTTKEGQFERTDYHPCKGVGCPHCKANVPKVKNLRMYLNPGTSHLSGIEAIASQISRKCKTRDCEGEVFPAYFVCEDCGAIIYDLTDLGPKERNDQRDLEFKEVRCDACGHTGLPKEITTCLVVTYDEDSGTPLDTAEGCTDPERFDIFDVDVRIAKEGEGTGSQIVMKDYRYPHKDAGDVDVDDIIDFGWLCDPSTDAQAKALGCVNPFEPDKQTGAKAGTVSRGKTPY